MTARPVWTADRTPAHGPVPLPRRGPGGVLPARAPLAQTTDKKLPGSLRKRHGQVMWVSRVFCQQHLSRNRIGL